MLFIMSGGAGSSLVKQQSRSVEDDGQISRVQLKGSKATTFIVSTKRKAGKMQAESNSTARWIKNNSQKDTEEREIWTASRSDGPLEAAS